MLTTARRILALALLTCGARPALAQPSGPDGNIPLPAAELQRRLQNDPFEIVAVGTTHGGITKTAKLTLAFADGQRVEVKWKAAPSGGEGWDNSPRRELAAYTAQQLFLGPDDFVVPPVAVRCIPLDAYRPVDPSAKPNLPHARCIYGTFSAWLENVKEPDKAWDPDRFSRDPGYAYRFGNLNLFTYLIAHHDAKASNFLMSTDGDDPRIYSIDNGIAFAGVYNVLTWHFDHILVGGLPARSVERLQQVRPEDLDRLAVLAELQPAGTDHQQGLRTVGNGIQIGLTTAEIAGMSERLQKLLADVREGKEQVF
jgi:hypothetical protein